MIVRLAKKPINVKPLSSKHEQYNLFFISSNPETHPGGKKGVKNTYSIQNKIIIFFFTFMQHKWRRYRQDKFNFCRFKFA